MGHRTSKRRGKAAERGSERGQTARALAAAADLVMSGDYDGVDEMGMPVTYDDNAFKENLAGERSVDGGVAVVEQSNSGGGALADALAKVAVKSPVANEEPRIKYAPFSPSAERVYRHSMAGTRIGSGSGR